MIVGSNDLQQNVDDSSEATDSGPVLPQETMQDLSRRADVCGVAEFLLQTRDDWSGVWVVPRHLY